MPSIEEAYAGIAGFYTRSATEEQRQQFVESQGPAAYTAPSGQVGGTAAAPVYAPPNPAMRLAEPPPQTTYVEPAAVTAAGEAAAMQAAPSTFQANAPSSFDRFLETQQPTTLRERAIQQGIIGGDPTGARYRPIIEPQPGNMFIPQSAIDVPRGIALDIAGYAGTGLANTPQLGPYFQALEAATGVTPEQATRFTGDIFLPRSEEEVGLELLPGVGTVPDVLRGGQVAVRGAQRVLPEVAQAVGGAAPDVRRAVMQGEFGGGIPPLPGRVPEPTPPRAPTPATPEPTGFAQLAAPPPVQRPVTPGLELSRRAVAAPPRPPRPPVGAGPSAGGQPPVPPQRFIPTETPNIPRPSVIRTVDEIAQEAQRSAARGLQGQVGQLPIVRSAVNLANPSALVDRPSRELVEAIGDEAGAVRLQTGLLGHARKMDEVNNIASMIEDSVRQGTRRAGLQIQDGRFVNVPGSPLVGDFFENPTRFKATPRQRAFADQIQAVLEDMNQVEQRAGVPKNEIFSEEGRYFPRHVESVRGVEARSPIRRPTGAKQGFAKERYWEMQEEGAKNGVDYLNDPAADVGIRIRAGFKAVADRELGEIAKPFGRTMAVAEGGGPRVGEMGTMIPAVGGYVFPNAVSKALLEAVGTRYGGDIERLARNVTDPIRMTQAIGDFSFWGLQALLTLSRNPAAFAKMAATTFDTLVRDGRAYGQYMNTNARQLERFARSGGLWRSSDIDLGTPSSRNIISKTLGKLRIGQAFDNSMNVLALENFKAIAGVEQAVGPSFVTKAFQSLGPGGQRSDEIAAAVANKMAGRFSSRAAGVGQGQRSIESLVTFAPNYYRAAFGLLADATQGGMRGAEARRTLASFVTAGILTHVAIAEAVGQEPNLDPFSSKFLTLEVGGQNVGPGGIFLGIARTIAESAENPDLLTEASLKDNPALRWARGRLSPLLSMAVDLGTGSTFQGAFEGVQDVRGLENIAEWAGTRVLPFAAQTGIQEGDATAAGASFLGGRAFPESISEQRTEEIVGQIIPSLIDKKILPESVRGLGVGDLGAGEYDAVRRELLATDPDLARRWEEDRRKQGSPFQIAQDAALAADEEMKVKLDQLQQRFISGQGTKEELRDAIADAKLIRADDIADAYNSPEYKKAAEGFGDANDIRALEAIYYSIPEKMKVNGVIDWDKVDQGRRAFMTKLQTDDPEMASRFANNLLIKDKTSDLHPLLKLQEQVNRNLTGYWDLPEEQKGSWLAQNPDANVGYWMLYSDSGVVRSIEAAEKALNTGIPGTVKLDGETINGTRTPVTRQNISVFKQYQAEITRLINMQTDDPATSRNDDLRTNLRKTNLTYDALHYWLGLTAPDKDDNTVVVYHSPQTILNQANQWGGRADGAIPRLSR